MPSIKNSIANILLRRENFKGIIEEELEREVEVVDNKINS